MPHDLQLEVVATAAQRVNPVSFMALGSTRDVVLASKLAALRPVYGVDGVGSFELLREPGDQALVAKLKAPALRSYILVAPVDTSNTDKKDYLASVDGRLQKAIEAKSLVIEAYEVTEFGHKKLYDSALAAKAYSRSIVLLPHVLLDTTYVDKKKQTKQRTDLIARGEKGPAMTAATREKLLAYVPAIGNYWPQLTAAQVFEAINQMHTTPKWGLAEQTVAAVNVGSSSPAITEDDIDLSLT